MEVEYLRDLVPMIEKDEDLKAEISKDPAKALAKIAMARSPLDTDPLIYRIVVSALGATVLIAVIGGIYLAAKSITPTPEILIALGSAAVGALAGLLTPKTPSK